MWYEAVSGPSEALSESSKVKLSRIALNSSVKAVWLAATVRCGMSEPLQLDERLDLIFFDRRIVRHRGTDRHRTQLHVDHAVAELEGHHVQRDAQAGQHRELQHQLDVALERAFQPGRRDVHNLDALQERLQIKHAAKLLEAHAAGGERVEAEALHLAERQGYQGRGR